ncbi:MAG: helix-turn-helix domain-containing protein [bacterium]|nr:helix-turn-helix domain-containing protein [bacterium]
MDEIQVKKAFSKVLKELRAERGLTQEKLGLLAGLDHNYIGLLERQLRQPTLTSILKLAAALKISPEQLVRHVTSNLS